MWYVVGKTTLYRGFVYKAVGCGPRFSAARRKCQMGLLNPTLNCFDNSQEIGEHCQ